MAIARVLVITLIAGVAVGCGAQAPERKAAQTVTRPADVASTSGFEGDPTELDDAGGGSGSMMFFLDGGGGATRPEPAQALYAVFHRPLDAGDRAAAAFARSDDILLPGEESGPAAGQLGRPLYSDTRLVGGTTGHGLYATPTTSGAVCTRVFPNGGGGCGLPGPHGVTLGWDDPADGSPGELYGMAGDDVRAVEIVLDGKHRTVAVENNAYLIEIPRAGRGDFGSIVLRLTDGTTVPLG
jgi:hypothetical protein